MKSLMKTLTLSFLFLAGSSIFLVKYDTFAAVKQDEGKFHQAELILQTQKEEVSMTFHDPVAFYHAYQTADEGVRHQTDFQIGDRYFELGEATHLKVKLNTHSGDERFKMDDSWLDKVSGCGCKDREERSILTRVVSGLEQAREDLFKG